MVETPFHKGPDKDGCYGFTIFSILLMTTLTGGNVDDKPIRFLAFDS
jgi:hypothetical protein